MKLRKVNFIFLTILLFGGCQFAKNVTQHATITEIFTNCLISEDYGRCVNSFALESEYMQGSNIDSLKAKLPSLRQAIVDNFGSELTFKLMSAEKKISTIAAENTPKNATRSIVQFSNTEYFGLFEVYFYDTSNKIININLLEVKRPIPSMWKFWLFGLACLGVLVFNIYVIKRIYNSNLKKKWIKTISVIFLNFPTISCNPIAGFSLKLSFQFLFGIGFMNMGYLNSYLSFGVPLGGLYWLYRLNKNKSVEVENKDYDGNDLLDVQE